MASPSLIETSCPDEGIKMIIFNRPQKRNALSQELIGDFLGELAKASRDPDVRVIIISGSGSFFSGETCLSSFLTPAWNLTDLRG
jgi:enoyl-CoA hydratase